MLAGAIGFAAITAGCGAPVVVPPERANTDGLFGAVAPGDTSSLADIRWNELFTDPNLLKLVGEGIERNPDLAIAERKVREAEAYFEQSSAALFPSLSAAGRGTYGRNSESIYPKGPRESKTWQLGFESGWEADIWGRLRSAKRAQYANLLGSEAGRKAVQTRLVADIATAYYRLLSLDARLAITEETVRKYVDLVETMKTMKESAKVTGAAVVQSEATRYSAEITIPDLRQSIRETEHVICLLTGRPGGTVIERGKLADQPPAPFMKVGVPARLLDNRPDVMRAKYQVMQAYEITKSARAAFYPSLNITATGGLAALDIDELFDPGSFAASVIGGLAQPVFDRKANRTRLKVARAQQDEAVLGFKSTLLAAGNEVQDALGSYQASTEKMRLRELQMDSLVKSVEYTRELLNYGSANYIEVLNAEQGLLAAQINGVNDRLQQLSAVVTLYRALGGGWK